jgi:hypothetical protein
VRHPAAPRGERAETDPRRRAGSTKAEETYYGDRTVEAFFAWIEHEHKVCRG